MIREIRRTIAAALVAAAAGGVSAVVATPAYADEAPDATRLAVVVDEPAIDAEPLKRLLEADLMIQIRLAQTAPAGAGVTIRSSGPTQVAIAFARADGTEIRRTMDLPHRRDVATETVAYATANLLRNEAAELLVALQKAAAAAAPPAPEPPPAPKPAPAPEVPPPHPCSRPFDMAFGGDFFPRVGTSSFRPDGVRVTSLNLLGGYARGLHGFEVSAGVGIQREFMCGLQVAGAANLSLGPVEGIQVAPFDFAGGAMQGAQVGVGALAAGKLYGLQVGTVNLALDDVYGLQSGVVQLARGQVHGVQAGTVNLAVGAFTGMQAGTVNVTTDDMTGLQAGPVNVATGTVRGLQLGVVNYADDAAAQIGVVSIDRRGHTEIQAWGTESGLAMAAVRHGGAVIHNLYGVGWQLGGENQWALALGLGIHVPLGGWLGLDIDAIEHWLHKDFQFRNNENELATLQTTVAIPVRSLLELFAGPTFNVHIAQDTGTGLAPPWPHWDFQDGTTFVHGWIGLNGGLRLKL